MENSKETRGISDFERAKKYVVKKGREKNMPECDLKQIHAATIKEEIIIVLKNNTELYCKAELLEDAECLEYFGVPFLDLLNTGHGNKGHGNTGHENEGHENEGNYNKGDRNKGHGNVGDDNEGNRNIGNRNIGNRNIGNYNVGDRNKGDENAGNYNEGNRNIGNGNKGDDNKGDDNVGSWNKGSKYRGYFNTVASGAFTVFNKPCSIERWGDAKKPEFIYNIKSCFRVDFKDMTEDEKGKHPKADRRNGYLKIILYEEAWETAFDNTSEKDIELLKALPNWDAKVFLEISGIDLR